MSIISPKQCRAARQLLGWVQSDLAQESGVGVATIGTFEKDGSANASTINDLSKALERAGIIFLDGHGLKLRSEDTCTYKGALGCASFFEQMIVENNGEILAYIKSQDMLTRYCGEPRQTLLERLEQLHEASDVKCILADRRPSSFPTPAFEMRTVPNLAVSPTTFFIYNDKLAILSLDARLEMRILVDFDAAMVRDFQHSFMTYWKLMTLQSHTSRVEDRAVSARA